MEASTDDARLVVHRRCRVESLSLAVVLVGEEEVRSLRAADGADTQQPRSRQVHAQLGSQQVPRLVASRTRIASTQRHRTLRLRNSTMNLQDQRHPVNDLDGIASVTASVNVNERVTATTTDDREDTEARARVHARERETRPRSVPVDGKRMSDDLGWFEQCAVLIHPTAVGGSVRLVLMKTTKGQNARRDRGGVSSCMHPCLIALSDPGP